MAEKAKRPPRKRAKQGHLPGMEPITIPALEGAAANYYDVIMERVDLSKQEADAKQNLLGKMHENKLERYITGDGLVVMCLSKDSLSVKKKKDAPSPEANGEE